MEIVQVVKKLNSISWERLNFRRQRILCTTLYRNPKKASNFGGTLEQLFLWILLWNFHTRYPSTFSIPWCKKKVKNDQKNQIKGSCLKDHDWRADCQKCAHWTIFSALRWRQSCTGFPSLLRSPCGIIVCPGIRSALFTSPSLSISSTKRTLDLNNQYKCSTNSRESIYIEQCTAYSPKLAL